MSLGSEARPTRLNSGRDVDFVSFVAEPARRAVRHALRRGRRQQRPLRGQRARGAGLGVAGAPVGATAKDYDVNHDDTLSGDPCAGWSQHPSPGRARAPVCRHAARPAAVRSRRSPRAGPSGDVWLRPDLVAPGYNIVSAQAAPGAAIAQNDSTRTRVPTRSTRRLRARRWRPPAASGASALLLPPTAPRIGSGRVGASGCRRSAGACVRAGPRRADEHGRRPTSTRRA